MGRRPDLEKSEGYLATDRVFNAIGLNSSGLDAKSAEPYVFQFNAICDTVLGLTNEGLKQNLAVLVADENNRKKVEELVNSGRAGHVGAGDQT